MTDLKAIASRFVQPGSTIGAVRPLGRGNINDTFLVRTSGGHPGQFVLQRLNTKIFKHPQQVMANIAVVARHLEGRLAAGVLDAERRWVNVFPLPCSKAALLHTAADGSTWRALSFVEQAVSVDEISTPDLALEIGRGLGTFHLLLADLDSGRLADTLPGFHITPGYLEHYDRVLAEGRPGADADIAFCLRFVEERRGLAAVLENAKAKKILAERTIHGDPKVNNIMLDEKSGRAVAMVDLDTVKPGLVHYDIGDCLRSACNRLGEETREWRRVHFDLQLCRPLLRGYLGAAGSTLSAADRHYLFDAARLLAFELGLRFFTDHLAGDLYFRTTEPGHNLRRALVQFRLCASIEEQEKEIRAMAGELP